MIEALILLSSVQKIVLTMAAGTKYNTDYPLCIKLCSIGGRMN
jgi:hypothetical protein